MYVVIDKNSIYGTQLNTVLVFNISTYVYVSDRFRKVYFHFPAVYILGGNKAEYAMETPIIGLCDVNTFQLAADYHLCLEKHTKHYGKLG